MSLATNTVTRYDAYRSVREDLSNVIYNISPTETPFMSNVGRDKAAQTFSEWQTDALVSPNGSNAVLEGDDAPAADSVSPTHRVGNYTQISRKIAQVSGTVESIGLAGMKSMMGYQMAKKSAELKRDMEYIVTGDQVAVVGNNTTARKTAALGAWIITNAYVGATTGAKPIMSSGSDGYPATIAVAGDVQAFTETALKTVLQAMWTSGGNIDRSFLLVDGTNKAVISGFAGIATKYKEVQGKSQAVIIGAADVYVGDFGNIRVVPSRFLGQPKNVYAVDPELCGIAYLRGFRTEALAKTGDNTKRMLIVEYMLKIKNEAGLAVWRDSHS
jgi:hypothetical protein